MVGIHEFIVLGKDEGTKIDLLTQRDSPEEHLIAAVYRPMEALIQASEETLNRILILLAIQAN